jgi:hypothetical protein
MRLRLMATYLGVPYQVGLGPDGTEATLFSSGPPPEELGFTAADGHWRKQVSVTDLDALWQARTTGNYRGEPCLVLEDLDDRLHIAYLGRDATRAAQLGYWEIDREVFEVVVARHDVSGLADERVDFPLTAAMFSAPGGPPPGGAEPLADGLPTSREEPPPPAQPSPAGATPAEHATPDEYATPGEYAAPGEYATPGGYEMRAEHATPAEYAMPDEYATRDEYATPDEYATRGEYALPDECMTQNEYATPDEYATPAGYGCAEHASPMPDRMAAWHGSPEPWPAPGFPVEGIAVDWAGEGTGLEHEDGAGAQPSPEVGHSRERRPDRRSGPWTEDEPDPRGPRPWTEDEPWSDPWTEREPGSEPETAPVPRRRTGRRDRISPESVFAELLSLAAIPQAAYAVDEEVPGAMCLVEADGGFEVFSRTDDARLEVHFFEDEEAAYFYLFGVLAAEAVRSGRLGPSGPAGANGHRNGSVPATPQGPPGTSPTSTGNVSKYLRGRN